MFYLIYLIFIIPEQFRCSIRGTTTKRLHECARFDLGRESKVSQFHPTRCGEEHILCFDVAVDYGFLVLEEWFYKYQVVLFGEFHSVPFNKSYFTFVYFL